MGHSAAEIERYTYCPLSWWLARDGIDGRDEALKRGIERHAAKGKRLTTVQRIRASHRKSLDTALYLALVAASGSTLAIEVTFLDWEGLANRMLMLLALFSLFASLAFLAHAIVTQESARRERLDAGIVAGDVAYSDLDKPGDVLRSAKYDIGGRPDYVVRQNGHLIPVEVKSGHTPKHPHESHVLQLGAYCVLVEETFGRRPPFGIVSYEECKFEVPFTDELKDRVLETVLRMRLAEVTGNVHRNHDRRAKCGNCSRRFACPERLPP